MNTVYCYQLMEIFMRLVIIFWTNRKLEQKSLIPVKVNGKQKFKEISSHNWLNISIAKAVNDYRYVWGECERQSFLTPHKTDIKWIDEFSQNNPKQKSLINQFNCFRHLFVIQQLLRQPLIHCIFVSLLLIYCLKTLHIW